MHVCTCVYIHIGNSSQGVDNGGRRDESDETRAHGCDARYDNAGGEGHSTCHVLDAGVCVKKKISVKEKSMCMSAEKAIQCVMYWTQVCVCVCVCVSASVPALGLLALLVQKYKY
jgi:hypothetical protein